MVPPGNYHHPLIADEAIKNEKINTTNLQGRSRSTLYLFNPPCDKKEYTSLTAHVSRQQRA